MLEGRAFIGGRDRQAGCVVINETMARRFWLIKRGWQRIGRRGKTRAGTWLLARKRCSFSRKPE